MDLLLYWLKTKKELSSLFVGLQNVLILADKRLHLHQLRVQLPNLVLLIRLLLHQVVFLLAMVLLLSGFSFQKVESPLLVLPQFNFTLLNCLLLPLILGCDVDDLPCNGCIAQLYSEYLPLLSNKLVNGALRPGLLVIVGSILGDGQGILDHSSLFVGVGGPLRIRTQFVHCLVNLSRC